MLVVVLWVLLFGFCLGDFWGATCGFALIVVFLGLCIAFWPYSSCSGWNLMLFAFVFWCFGNLLLLVIFVFGLDLGFCSLLLMLFTRCAVSGFVWVWCLTLFLAFWVVLMF